MAKDSFRLSGVKHIEVNDDGECITLNLNNAALISGFGDIQVSLKKAADDFKRNAEEINKKNCSEDEKKMEVCNLNCELCRGIYRDVDKLFGAETCRKVFGSGIVPDVFSFLELFEHLTPYIQQFGQERAAKMSKYSPNRTGSL